MSGGRQLVGRREEIDMVSGVLTSSASRSLVLGGQAGVGKTRLAQEVADRWAASGKPVEWITGTSGASTIPFGAVARLLAEPTSQPEGMAARDVDVIRATVAAARDQPDRLLVIDDGHSLDELSALLVQHLVLARVGAVLVTVRNGEPAPAALAAVWRDRHAERIDLQPLSEPEAVELVAAAVGGPVDRESGAALYRASEGNPLLLDVLVRDAVESGALHADAGGWRWDGRLGSGRHLRDAVGRRIGALDAAGRRLLSVLAVAEPLSASMLVQLVPEVDLHDAEDRGLVKLRSDGKRREVRLGHPLLGEVLLAGAPAATLHPLRIEVADAIAATGARRRSDLLFEARLRIDAGGSADTRLLVGAAQRSLELGAGEPAVQLAEAAIAGGAAPIARLLLAQGLQVARRQREALEMFEDVAPELADDAERVRAAMSLQHLFHLDPARVEALNRDVAGAVEDPVWQAVIEGNAIQQQMMRGETAEATRRAEALLAAHDDPRTRLRLVSSVGSGRALAGRTEEAMALAADLLPVALEHQGVLPLGPAWVMNAQAIGLLTGGKLTDAVAFVDLLRMLLTQGVAGTVDGQAAWLDLFAGRIDLARGRIATASAQLSRAAAGLGHGDMGGFFRWARSLEAEALALLGDLPAAREASDDATSDTSWAAIYDGEAARARAWVRALGGELGRAIDELLELAALQELEGQRSLELQTLHDAVRLGAVAEAGERTLRVADEVDGLWPAPIAAHVRALRTGAGAELEAAGELFADMDAALHAAEAMAEAARAYGAEGLRTRQAAALRRRDVLLGEVGAVRTPALHDLPEAARLTRREREVVELASQGLSNKDIADRLFVSLRTAEGHLYRAFAKLGVEDRSELRAALGNA